MVQQEPPQQTQFGELLTSDGVRTPQVAPTTSGTIEPICRFVGGSVCIVDSSETQSKSSGCEIASYAHHQVQKTESTQRRSQRDSGSLNADPYNTQAEELAVAECARGLEVRRTWTEKEMVCSFGGCVFPGTPDGMFETWEGELTCVQVVRVPIVSHMSDDEVQEVLSRTVLTKVVKSQSWLRATHTAPFDFVIFCWLPFSINCCVAERTHELMRRVQDLDPRFSLRLRVPAIAGSLFPALFAHHTLSKMGKGSVSICESDVSTYNEETESEDDEECVWDITWAWEDDLSETKICQSQGVEAEVIRCSAEEESDWEQEWDVTWNWGDDCSLCDV